MSVTFNYQKVKNTTFDEFFRCMAHLGFNCKKKLFKTNFTWDECHQGILQMGQMCLRAKT